MGKDNRCFREVWFKDRDWLEYSVSKDAAFCFWCYLFRPSNIGFGGDDVFTRSGFINWKKAIEKFNEHVGGVGSAHNEARIQFEGFKNQRQSVEYSFSSEKHELEVAYRKRLTSILKVIRFLLLQGLPFRGHDESSTSSNRGNFLELLKWYSSECPEVAAVVGMNAPGNNQMIAPKIQKQLVNACAVETTNAILADLGDRWFTLLLDEARDCSVKEQMAVVIRYVNKHGEVIERFMAVVHVATTTAACLKEAIDSLFAKYSLSVARLRGQGYDGASNMSGEFNGLKSLIMKENPYALYVHYFALQLQLVVVAVAQANQYVCDFMWIVGSIVNTSASSCKRADKLRQLEHDRKVKLLERGEISSGRGLNQETSLARPGDTRWGSHHSTLCRIEQMWPSVIEVLQNLIDDGDRSSKGLSRTLVERMERNSFSRFDVQKLVRLAHFYTDDFSWSERILVEQELETYIDDVRSDERFEGISDLGALAKKMIETMKNRVFPLVYRMIELALLLPVATATVERVFSAMNIVKTDLRNRIGDEWMNDSLVVYIEKDVFNTVDNEPIL
ncbi:zinc finger MYM-type protein 1-like [Zingiber officinale]|uniref:zinc finger MYM-type protein 1-like n=1 Tax=Zingiber officinale TaxID=94328 RepID=UPI001C4B044E|nr:zinc finger MYM-type protein 1-like [Zingiber officinale]